MKPTAKQLLRDYMLKFDDEKLSDAEIKRWLDRVWIPAVRCIVGTELSDKLKNCRIK